MRKSHFTEAQIIEMLKEQGSSVKRFIQRLDRGAERDGHGRHVPQARAQPGDVSHKLKAKYLGREMSDDRHWNAIGPISNGDVAKGAGG